VKGGKERKGKREGGEEKRVGKKAYPVVVCCCCRGRGERRVG